MTQQQGSTQVIALYADESVPYGRIVEVLDMTSRHNLKMVLATKPTGSLTTTASSKHRKRSPTLPQHNNNDKE